MYKKILILCPESSIEITIPSYYCVINRSLFTGSLCIYAPKLNSPERQAYGLQIIFFVAFPNKNVIIFELLIHWNLQSFLLMVTVPSSASHQVSVLCSAAWSILTVGTAMRSAGCAASRRTNTAWGLALYVGLTSWLLWASWTLSSSPFWLLFWATDRMASCQRSCWRRARVSFQDEGFTGLELRGKWQMSFVLWVRKSYTWNNLLKQEAYHFPQEIK